MDALYKNNPPPEILKTEFDVTLGLTEPVKKSKAKAKKILTCNIK